MVSNELLGYPVQLEGRYTRLDMFCQFPKRLSDKSVRLAHQLYLIFCLQKYLHRRLVCSHSAAVDTTGAKQAIIVAHQQVTLNLCKCVEHYTNQDQE